MDTILDTSSALTDGADIGQRTNGRRRATMSKENVEIKPYSIGEYIIYVNGDKYEIGRIKSICDDGAFVAYHEGETGAKTSWKNMHKLINEYCIKETTLGGGYFGRME